MLYICQVFYEVSFLKNSTVFLQNSYPKKVYSLRATFQTVYITSENIKSFQLFMDVDPIDLKKPNLFSVSVVSDLILLTLKWTFFMCVMTKFWWNTQHGTDTASCCCTAM